MSTTNIHEVTLAWDGVEAKAGDFASKILRKVALDLMSDIIGNSEMPGTPVDTGRARANWHADVGTPTEQVIGTDEEQIEFRKTGNKYSLPPPPPLEKLDPTQPVYILNNLPYIQALEDGHSQKQAPNGMVRIAIEKMEGRFQQAAEDATK